MSAAARAYAFGPIVEFNTIDQEIVAGSVSGELWQGFGAGGPLTSAFGAEYRKEGLRNDVNSDLPDPTRIDIVAQYGDDSAATWRRPKLRRVRASVAREQAGRAALVDQCGVSRRALQDDRSRSHRRHVDAGHRELQVLDRVGSDELVAHPRQPLA